MYRPHHLLSTCLPIAALAAAAGFASAASATVVTWDYTVTSEFTAATFTTGGGTATETPTEISWGATGGTLTSPCGDPSACRSAIGIDRNPISGTIDTNGPFEDANIYRHNNNIISASFADLSTATLEVTIELAAAVPPGADADPLSRTFEINFFETPNAPASGICADGTAVGSAGPGCQDIFVLEFDFGQFDFTFDGEDYTLFLFEDPTSPGYPKLDFLPDEACLATVGTTGCFGFMTQENALTRAPFVIEIDQVPEPAALGLLGLGLLGLGVSRRRKA
jgi:hypothetical protein